MGAFLGKSSPTPTAAKAPAAGAISEADKAVLTLKGQRDKLKQYQQKIQGVIDLEVEYAKKHLANGDKKRALLCLRKKKFQQTLLERAEAQLVTVEEMTATIEFTAVQKEVIDGIRMGKDVLQELNDQMKIEDVEKLMDDTADAIAYQKEVDAILHQNLSAEDDEAAQEELDRILEEQEAAGQADAAAGIEDIDFPEVPNTDPNEALASSSSKSSSANKSKSRKTTAAVAAS